MKKKLFGFGAVFIIFFIGLIYSYSQGYLNPETIQIVITDLGPIAPIAYGIVYFILILFFIPSTAFTVLAGVLFGELVGTTVVVISATLSAMTAFIIARKLGVDFVHKVVKKNNTLNTLLEKIESNSSKNGFVFFFIMRSLFLPYILFSYAAGLVEKAKLRDFSLATFVTNIIYSFAFVYLGDSLMSGPQALILPVILVILVYICSKNC